MWCFNSSIYSEVGDIKENLYAWPGHGVILKSKRDRLPHIQNSLLIEGSDWESSIPRKAGEAEPWGVILQGVEGSWRQVNSVTYFCYKQ